MVLRKDLMANAPVPTHLPVLVPVENTHWAQVIIRGSALIALPSNFKHGKTLIHYEGNKFGYKDMMRFADKCYAAASRGMIGYPTTATAIIAPSDLIEVGSWDLQQKVVEITNPEPLLAWCGWEQIGPEELISTQ